MQVDGHKDWTSGNYPFSCSNITVFPMISRPKDYAVHLAIQ